MYRRLLSILFVFVFVSAACSISTTTVTPTPAPTSPPPSQPTAVNTPTTAALPTLQNTLVPNTGGNGTGNGSNSPGNADGLVTSLDNVKSATVQVIAEGTFVDPQVGVQVNAGDAGSGFFIDPSGIAITNNHVVTGAAELMVYVGGDTQNPKHAQVLGVSECSDLAVIKVEGGPYPYLAFDQTPQKVGTEVYAAGYPLGNPEFTLTRGIVSKAKAGGNSDWASVENVIEHDATIRPGNSGGPLVDANGQVVGINYAGATAGPFYAIAPAEAKGVIDTLRSGKDVTSLGINGVAVVSQDQTLSGIWVRSVKSGSLADKAGVQAGDIITQLEGIVLATDGTMSDYCNILRSHQPSDTLSLTILRFADQTVLQGEINGRQLAVAQTFTTGTGTGQPTQTSSNGGTSTSDNYANFVTVTNDSDLIELSVPAEWTQVDGTDWKTTWGSENIDAPAITASANMDAFNNSWDESGIFVTASSDLGRTGGYIELLDGVKSWFSQDCKLDSTSDLNNSVYQGKYQVWKNCGSNGAVAMVVVARPQKNPTSYLVLMVLHITKNADVNALDTILGSFNVKGGV